MKFSNNKILSEKNLGFSSVVELLCEGQSSVTRVEKKEERKETREEKRRNERKKEGKKKERCVMELGVVACTYNLSTWGLIQYCQELKAILCCIKIPYHKKRRRQRNRNWE